MFAITTNVGFAQRVVATLVAGALLLWSVGAYSIARAANLTSVSDTLSTSEPSVTSAHTIAFTVPTGSSISNADTVTITFPTAANEFSGVASVVSGDVSITVGGTGTTTSNFSAGASSISFDTITASAGQEVVVAIADGKIVNPSISGVSYEIVVDTGTGGDTGRTRVAIVDTVLVTATVDTSFNFSITGVATSTPINGTSTTGSTTATAIPFGHVVAGGVYTMAQDLAVSTNARNGFVVTVETDHQLLSSNGADIDGFSNGTYVNTPTAWSSPTNSITDENTWGHWGLTSEDSDLNGGEFVSNKWVSASTTPRQVFSHTGPADGATTDIGTTTVGYQLEITPLQEAADDYNATLTYIATPTF